MRFPRQQYWSGLLFPSPGDLSELGIRPRFPALPADSLPSEPPGNLCKFVLLGLGVEFQDHRILSYSDFGR